MSVAGAESVRGYCGSSRTCRYYGVQKYNRKDIRDILERASARETASRVAVGGFAKNIIKSLWY